MRSVHRLDYSAIKRKEVLPCATGWMNLKDVRSETSQMSKTSTAQPQYSRDRSRHIQRQRVEWRSPEAGGEGTKGSLFKGGQSFCLR